MDTEFLTDDDFTAPEHPDFGWSFHLGELRHHKVQQKFKANPDQLEELALYLGMDHFEDLDIELMVKPKRSDAYFDIYMKVKAKGAQSCVATGEPIPFAQELTETHNVSVEHPQMTAGEVQLSELDLDGPEYVENGKFDPLKIALEMLVLELDPYPRKEDAAIIDEQDKLTDDDVKPNPFAGLAALKNKLN